MTYLVPFDGSDLATAALERATEFADDADGGVPVIALVVVPDEPEYARERGWVEPDEQFDTDLVCDRLADAARAVAPDVEVRCRVPEDVEAVGDVTTDVVRTIREVADEVDAEVVFVGSENAGRVSTPITSVGAPVSQDPRYDVHIVRHAE